MIHARHFGLAQAAGVGVDAIALLHDRVHADFGVLHALVLVVTVFAQRPDRTARNALATGAMAVEQTIGPVVVIGSRGRR